MVHEDGHGLVHELVRVQHVGPCLPHHAPQDHPQLIHQCQAQVVHVAEVAIEGGGYHFGLPGDFPNAQAGEVAPPAHQRQGRLHEDLPGFTRTASFLCGHTLYGCMRMIPRVYRAEDGIETCDPFRFIC